MSLQKLHTGNNGVLLESVGADVMILVAHVDCGNPAVSGRINTRIARCVLGANPASPVLILVATGCPMAVAFGITLIVVHAIKGFTKRPFPHVGKERLKRSTPPSTDCDASSSVVFETFMLWVFAALNHVPVERVEVSLMLGLVGIAMFPFSSHAAEYTRRLGKDIK
jgi:hypothetical protein